MDLGLTGRRAIITGGSKGLGFATAASLIDEHTAVAFCARNASEVAEAQAALNSRTQ